MLRVGARSLRADTFNDTNAATPVLILICPSSSLVQSDIRGALPPPAAAYACLQRQKLTSMSDVIYRTRA